MIGLAALYWKFWLLSVGTILDVALRYLFFAGVAWVLGYVCFKSRWAHRKIIPRAPSNPDIWREIRYSALSAAIFGTVGAVTVLAVLGGRTRAYWHFKEHGWGWFWLSIGCVIVLHDTWFYWTHRLMHHPRLFRWFHRTHHLSRNPTPWAAYAFDPSEAVIQALIFPLAMFLIPMHPLAFAAFMVWQIVFNVAGHTGYEYTPRWFGNSWLRYVINTPTNHIMHHEKLRGNYGLYFNYWDRLMGTNHGDYEERFRRVTSGERPVG